MVKAELQSFADYLGDVLVIPPARPGTHPARGQCIQVANVALRLLRDQAGVRGVFCYGSVSFDPRRWPGAIDLSEHAWAEVPTDDAGRLALDAAIGQSNVSLPMVAGTQASLALRGIWYRQEQSLEYPAAS